MGCLGLVVGGCVMDHGGLTGVLDRDGTVVGTGIEVRAGEW